MAEQKNVQEQDLGQLLNVRREKLAALQEEGKDPFKITSYHVTHHSNEIKEQFDSLEGKEVSVAGRMMSKRVMGKASFCHVQDLPGMIQAYVARDSVGEEEYKAFKKLDIGDLIGVKGTVFRTKTGEISIHAEEVTLLSKSLQILPEKFHGLTNTDLRYRQIFIRLEILADDPLRQGVHRLSHLKIDKTEKISGIGILLIEIQTFFQIYGGAGKIPDLRLFQTDVIIGVGKAHHLFIQGYIMPAEITEIPVSELMMTI